MVYSTRQFRSILPTYISIASQKDHNYIRDVAVLRIHSVNVGQVSNFGEIKFEKDFQ